MDLAKETIVHINDMAIANTQLLDAQALDYKGVLIPATMKLETLEQFQQFKNRFKGVFITSSIDSFSEYVNNYENASCFINCNDPVATAIFDLGTIAQPGHAEHKSTLNLDSTPEYDALVKFEKELHTQQKFAEFIEDWKFCITCTDASGNEMETKDAIQAVRHVTVEAKKKDDVQVGAFSANKSTLDQLDASNNGKPLPAWIIFSCSPYQGLKQCDFPMRVSLSMTRDTLTFKATFSNFAKIRDEFQKEFMTIIKGSLDTSKVAVYLGTWNK